MKRILMILMVCFGAWIVTAGIPMRWNKGSVVDKNGLVRVGEISIQTCDLILFKADNQVTVYTPFHLKSFFYFDQDLRMNRKYSSVKAETGNASFFEIVLWGQIQMIRSAKTKGLIKHQLNDISDFNYYVLWNNEIFKVEDFMEEVYPDMIKSLESFSVKSQELKMSNSYVENVFGLVKLYNTLRIQQGDAVARN